MASLTTVDEYINAIVATLPAPPPKYTEVNPFWFDEKAAEELATAEYSPYYKELVDDYMSDVNTQTERLQGDNTKILSELNSQRDYFIQDQGVKLDRAIRGVKEGYASTGLYFSGENQRTQKETQADYQSGINDYMSQHKYKVAGQQEETNRGLQDLTTQANRYQRDIGREKETAITGQVQTLKDEALDEYLTGAKTYYQNPDWSTAL